ncbi:hypothetical protein EV182_002758, partial [Spiromyces aspiralis]
VIRRIQSRQKLVPKTTTALPTGGNEGKNSSSGYINSGSDNAYGITSQDSVPAFDKRCCLELFREINWYDYFGGVHLISESSCDSLGEKTVERIVKAAGATIRVFRTLFWALSDNRCIKVTHDPTAAHPFAFELSKV